MIKTGTVPLRGVRTNALVVPIVIRGIDLTGAVLAAYVLQNWDNDPAYPEIEPVVTLDSVTDDNGVPVSNLTFSISAATMAGVPQAAEVGEDVQWVWYLDIQTDSGDVDTNFRYLEGPFYVGGTAGGSGSAGTITATIADQAITVEIDGASALGPLVEQAEAAQEAAADSVEQIAQVERAVFPHYNTAPALDSALLRVGTPFFFPEVNGVTVTLPSNLLVREIGRDSSSGGRFRLTMAEFDGVSTYTNRIGVAASGSHIVPTGYTGWKYIALKTVDGTSFPGIANGTQIGIIPVYFGAGENFGALGVYYTYAQAGLDTAFITADTIFQAKSANIATESLALVNQYFRSWARNTVTDRNLLGLVDDAVVEQGTPGRDYVIRYEKVAFPGIPLWRTRWFLYDPVLGRDVAFWAYSSASDPSATLESLYRPIFLADAALGSPIGPDYDAVVAKLSIESWDNAPWNIALTTTTDPAVAGIRRGQVIDAQTMQDRFSLGTETKRLLTYGNVDADYETLTDLVVAIRDPAIGSYTYSDWPTSFCSYSHQVEAVCVEPGYEEDLGDLVLPRWLTITGIWDTRLKGVTTRTFEQSFAGRIRRCRLRIEAVAYLGHMDNTDGVSEVSPDGILRHFETHMLEDCVIEVGAAQDVSVFGMGMDNNCLIAFRRCVVDVDPANTSSYPIFLCHSNPGVTRPGRLEIEDTIVLKRNRTGPDVLVQSLQTQGEPNIIMVKNSDLAEVRHEFGAGITTPAWQRRGKLSATTYSPELDPA